MQNKDKNNITSSKFDSKRREKMNLLYQRFWSDSLVVFTARSVMVDSDRRARKSKSYREGRGKEKELSREMVVLFKMKPE